MRSFGTIGRKRGRSSDFVGSVSGYWSTTVTRYAELERHDVIYTT